MNPPDLLVYVTKSNCKKMQNSRLELEWSKKLPPARAKEYLFSRGHARYFLSFINNITPLEVPLFSPPGKVPFLKNNSGYVSISHCKSACLIGWSKYPIGVDIEIKNRKLLSEKILNKYYSNEEKSLLLKNDSKKFNKKVLDYWIIKESSFKIRGGNFFSELNNLVVNQKNNTVLNKKFNSTYKYFLITLFDWRISVSFDMRIKLIKPLICYSN